MSPRRALSEFEGTKDEFDQYKVKPTGDEWDQYKVKRTQLTEEQISKMDAILKKEQFDKMDAILAQSSELDPFQTSSIERFFGGMGKGLVDIGRGVGQRLGLVTPEQIAEARKTDEELMRSGAFKTGSFTGSMLPWLAVPGGGESALARAGVAAATGAVQGWLQPTTKEESPSLNALLGGTLGAGTAGVLSAAGKGINVLVAPTKNAITSLSEKFGIRTTLGEAVNNPLIQKAESWLENVPLVGLKRFRQRQQTEAENAAKDFLSKYVVDPNAPDLMQANRQYASSLFQNLERTVSGIQNQSIPATETRASAVALLDRYPDIFKKFQDTKRETIIKDIVQGTKDIRAPLTTQVGGGTTSIPQTITFDEAWTLRQGLGEMIGQAKKKLAYGEVDQTTLGQLKTLFASVNRDIDSWANSLGRSDVREAINTANDAYKNFVVKYDILQRAYDKSTTMIGQEPFISPQKLSTNLTKIVQKDKAFNRFSQGEIEEMSGLANIMQIVKRAGQFTENPPTGNRWGIPIMAAEVGGYLAKGTAGGAVTAGGIIGLTGLARILTGTETGKRLIMAATKVEPTSPTARYLVNNLYSQLPKMVAEYGTSSEEGKSIGTWLPQTVQP